MLANHAPASNDDSPQGDSDYDTILAALMETARGRFFLQEYALRNRTTDTATLLTAIGRIEGLLTSRALEPAGPVAAEAVEPQHAEAPVTAPVEAEGSDIAAAAAIEAVVTEDTIFEYAEVAFTQGSIAGFEPEQPPGDATPATRDPFADIRALSDEEKIALFT
jgi:hypothetical protein